MLKIDFPIITALKILHFPHPGEGHIIISHGQGYPNLEFKFEGPLIQHKDRDISTPQIRVGTEVNRDGIDDFLIQKGSLKKDVTSTRYISHSSLILDRGQI